jgi:GTPase
MEVHERRNSANLLSNDDMDATDEGEEGLQLSNQDEGEPETKAASPAPDEAETERRETLRTLRLAFVGNVDSGKSSLIGTLIKGDLDDGRGSSRQAIFRHKHEIESGRTSSVATAYLGFDEQGQQILSKRAGKLIPWAELAKMASKRIQLIDLAGHEKYLKTTVFGLTGMQPDVVVVVVGANMGVKRMTKEHLAIAVAVSNARCARTRLVQVLKVLAVAALL